MASWNGFSLGFLFQTFDQKHIIILNKNSKIPKTSIWFDFVSQFDIKHLVRLLKDQEVEDVEI